MSDATHYTPAELAKQVTHRPHVASLLSMLDAATLD